MSDINSLKSKKEDTDTLLEWISIHHGEEEMRDVFLNMDIALKYIHSKGYCVEVFHPSKIEVLNNMPDHIRFTNIIPLSDDPVERRDMIKEDIFNSSLIQIGLYTNTLKYLSPNFLREKFDDISRFLPEGDIPYYRGVVQRGASVYFSEFAVEKVHRDLEQLEKQLSESEGEFSKPKINSYSMKNDNLENDSINDVIYKQISGRGEAAFASNIIIPGIILITVIVLFILIVLFRA